MAMHLPAKLSVPRVHAAVARPRLFGMLDSEADRQLVWVAGPAGSGKSTLVATYLADRRSPCVWYRADERDGELATFFSYLAMAVAAKSRRQHRTLPLLTPEYTPDVGGYARRFFRAFFAAMPASTHLVIDSHEKVPGAALDALLLVALEEAPPLARIVITSRERPPESLGHLLAMGRLQVIAWEDLRLTLAEATDVARRKRCDIDAAALQALHARSGGWTAGFVIMLGGVASRPPADGTLQHALFEYFAHELLASLDGTARALLLHTAVMTQFTAAQAQVLLAGTQHGADADDILRQLYRRNCFIDRSTHDLPSYSYHALFRDFLRRESRAASSDDAWTLLLRRAASAHRELGQMEDAIALLVEARAWTELCDILCTVAPSWLRQGRHVALRTAILALPPTELDASAWLLFWLGSAELPIVPAGARARLEAAHALFAAQGDARASLQACCGVLKSYWLEWNELRDIDLWSARFRVLADRPGAFVDAAEEVRTLCALEPMNFCAPRHRALLEHAVERVFQRFDVVDEPELRVMAANFVGFHCHYTGAWRRIQPLLQKVRACGDLERAPPDLVITWYLHEAGRAGQAGQHAAAMRHIASARQHADASGVHVLDMLVSAHAVYSELNAGELDSAHAHATDMRRMVDARRAIDVAHCDYMDAAIALARGDAGRAVRLTTHGVAMGAQCSADSVTAQFRALRGMALVEVGQFDDALAEAQRVLAYAAASGHGLFAYPALLLAAYARLRSGDHEAAGESLAQALALGQAREQVVVFPYMPLHMLQALYGHALREGIHADFVRGVIRVRRLPAPEDADRHWPWRVCIHALGHFELRVEGEPLRTTGKQPRKPIELLKAIVGFGGQDVRMDRLIRALWPEFAEGERNGDEVKAFEVTLHRLRKLLRADDAVTVGNRLVSLNPQCVWTDVREFEQASGRNSVTRVHPDVLADARVERSHLEAEVRCLLETYRGPFLPEAQDVAWTVTMRQRLGTMFRDGVLRLGTRLEAVDDRARARWLYEEAIARAPLSEQLYRRLMLCLLADGERAEAIAVFQRCRSVLSVLLGARPSPETEALHRRALDPAQG